MNHTVILTLCMMGQLTWALGALAVPYLGGKEVTAYEFTGL